MQSSKENKYDIMSVLLCDDIRQEINGKEILIGVYTTAIIFGGFPASMPRLMVRVSILPKSSDLKMFNINVISPSTGKSLFQMDRPLAQPMEADEPNTMIFAVDRPLFPEPAEYEIRFGIDKPPETISIFSVRPPKNDAERNRIAT